MITKISKEQEALIPKFYDEYLAIGLSTEPINLERMKPVIEAWYAYIKQPAPSYLVFSSPALCSIFCSIFLNQNNSQLDSQLDSQLRDQLRDQLRSQLGSQLHSQLHSQLGDQLRDQLSRQLGSQLYSQLGSQLRSQLGSQLHSQLYSQLDSQLDSQLGSQLRSQLDSQLRSQLGSQLYSQLDSQLDSQLGDQLNSQLRSQKLFDSNYWWTNLAACWISYYKCGELWGVELTPEVKNYLNQWDQIARHGFHWWPRVGVAVCSDRPRVISFNKEKRLHADGHKAIEFSDGWGVYANDGVRLPDKYGKLKTSDWKSEWILKEENAELKMCLIKNIGYEKICHDLQAKKIDSWREYELLRIENVDVEPIQLNKMTCPSTGKIHVHRVPPDIKTAREAIQWSNHGVDADDFLVEH